MSAASTTTAVPRDESSPTVSPVARGGSGDRPFSRPGPDYADMMSRYLGPQIMAAMADDDVTEIYVNPQDGRVRLDRRSRGRMDAGCVIGTERLEMFLNAVADTQATLLTPSSPTLQAELPAEVFRGARLQSFVPPVTPAASLVIRKRSDATFLLEDYVSRGMMSARARATRPSRGAAPRDGHRRRNEDRQDDAAPRHASSDPPTAVAAMKRPCSRS